MSYTIEEIKSSIKAQGQTVSPQLVIENLLTDSRNIIFPHTALFLAIKGKHQDGHKFIAQVYAEGVRSFVVEKMPDQTYPDANMLLVTNVVEALQQLATFHRSHFAFPIVGITGSNGKTIVKEWIYHLLKIKYDIVRSPKSYNSQIGVPLSVWQINSLHTLGIFEAGISQPEEMEALSKIIKPSIGIFTNVGEAHSEGFETADQKTIEKLKLFTHCDVIIYRKDYTLIDKHIPINKKTITWSLTKNSHADILIEDVEYLLNETLFKLQWNGKPVHFKIPFADAGSLENAIHAVIAALYIAEKQEAITELITDQAATLPQIEMRLELKKGINNCLVINDAYSADSSSLQIALNFMKQHGEGFSKTVILGDFEGNAREQSEFYTEVADLFKANDIKKFYGIGDNISFHKNAFHYFNSHYFSDTNSFINHFNETTFANEIILIKGARKFQLERVSNLLALKTHGTVLKIYLHHFSHNLNVYRSLLKPQVKIMVMVKAFSYGSGQAEIAMMLEHNRIDYLAVAYADEGIELRKQGIKTPIMVMNPEPEAFEQLFTYHLEPEIYNFRILHLISDFIKQKNISSINIHIKIDTGMHRLGFEEKDIDALIHQLNINPAIKVASIFSHLAAADDILQNDFSLKQIELFNTIAAQIQEQVNYPIYKHILNSPGISKFTSGQFDMVRLGIGLYGIDPADVIQKKLLPVSSLHTTISQIKNIQAGDSIGYGRSQIAVKNMRIATINIGYADGFSRRMSNGNGKVYVHGKLAPVVGKVCMDMTMIDISDIEQVKEGDEVELFGLNISINTYADWQQTIPYEIMTGISQRVKRIYLQE